MKFTSMLLFCQAAVSVSAFAADQATLDIARKLYEEHQVSVVAVTAVVKLQVSVSGSGNQTQEQSMETFGTIINDQGLTVVNYSALDVSSQIRAQVSQLEGFD